MNCKPKLRQELLEKRKAISKKRREEARTNATKKLLTKLEALPHILSFASKPQEIDLWPLNKALVKEGRLLFLRMISATELTPFLMTDLEKELLLHPKWEVLEPNPELCTPFPLDKISAVLVPGIGFDQGGGRLGYGKGCYDRFLAKLSCPLIGIGFKEQLLETPIPHEPHDISLTEVILF